jgi:hypothetical protein
MAVSIQQITKVSVTDEFKQVSKARLIARISSGTVQAKAEKPLRRTPTYNGFYKILNRCLNAIAGRKRVIVPLTVILVIVLAAGLLLPGMLDVPWSTPALASNCTLSIMDGNVEVKVAGADEWETGIDNMILQSGSQLRTATDSHALLTLLEGSSTKIEANINLEIEKVENVDEQFAKIILGQLVGKTWSKVKKMEHSDSYYRIDTPSAMVIVQGTSFVTEVDETGQTSVLTSEGKVKVLAQGQEVQLLAMEQTRVTKGDAPLPPEKMQAANTEFIVSTDAPVVISVMDPTGSSTGYLPNGLSFNQIAGSKSIISPEGTQHITIEQPLTGEYIIALRYTTQKTADFQVRAISDGKVVFEYTDKLARTEGEGLLIHVNLNVDDGKIASGTVSKIEPLTGKGPEKIVENEVIRQRAVPIVPKMEDTNGKRNSTDKNLTPEIREDIDRESEKRSTLPDNVIDETPVNDETADNGETPAYNEGINENISNDDIIERGANSSISDTE